MRRRFEYYDKDKDKALTQDELSRMIADVFGSSGVALTRRMEADVQLLVAQWTLIGRDLFRSPSL